MIGSTSGAQSPGGGNLSVLRVTEPHADFRRALARDLLDLNLDLTDNLADGENLTLKLSLSLCMRLAGFDLATTRWELFALRRDLLEVSGLDVSTEPVPLTSRDDARAVLNLSVYLVGLIDRAARSAGLGRAQVVESALTRS